MNELRLALEELRHFRLRTILILVSVALAFLAYGILGTLRFSLNSGEGSVAERRLIVAHRDGLMQPLPLAWLPRLQEMPGVQQVGHATWLGHFFRDPNTMLMSFAVDPQVWLDQHPDLIVDAESRRRFFATRDGVLISRALADKFGWRVGDRIPFGSIIYPPPAGEPAWSYVVTGTFVTDDSGGGRNYIISHFAYVNENRPVWRDTVGTFMVTPDEATSADSLAQRIDAEFAQSAFPTSTATDRAFHNQFFAQFGDVVQLIKSAIAITFTSLILIVTSGLALSVRQSSRDIGLMRVLGFGGSRIYRMVLAQTLLLVLGGSAIGLALAALANRLVTRAIPELLPDIVMPLPVLLESAVIALVVALATGFVPGWLALRVKPVDAFADSES